MISLIALVASAYFSGTPYYGVNNDLVWEPPADIAQLMVLLEESGAGSIRIPIRWSIAEPQQDQWNFAAIDAVVQQIPAHVEIVGLFQSVPLWANGVDPETAEGWPDAYPPSDIDDWSDYVGATVSYFKSRISHWEVWNEENGSDFYRPAPNPTEYTQLLTAAYSAAKSADPTCIVVLGGLAMNGIIANPWDPVATVDYLEDLYLAGAGPYFDVCNIHPYVTIAQGASHMVSLAQDTLDLMALYGDSTKPLWITEIGAPISETDTAQEQADLLADVYALTLAETQIERIFWFTLRDAEGAGASTSMGLVTRPMVKRPAFFEFVDAANSLLWLEFGSAEPEGGSEVFPYTSLIDTVGQLTSGGTLNIKPGQSSEVLTISKPMTIKAVGGAVQIGVP